MCSCNPTKGKYFTSAAIYRGKVSMNEIDEKMKEMRNKTTMNYAEWIPDNCVNYYCDITPFDKKEAASFIGNSSAVKSIFQQMQKKFKKMFKRNAFLHCYTGERMNSLEFD